MDEDERRERSRKTEELLREQSRRIIVAPTEAEQRYFDGLVAALAAGDFEAFASDPPPEIGVASPEERLGRLSMQRFDFDRYAGRLGELRGHVEVSLALRNGWRSVQGTFAARDPDELDIWLVFNRYAVGDEMRYGPAFLRSLPTERPIDPADRAEAERMAAALTAGDWTEYSRIVPGAGVQALWPKILFEAFGPRTGAVKLIENRLAEGDQRLIRVVMANRLPDGQDIALHLVAQGRGDRLRLTHTFLVEEGYDIFPLQWKFSEASRLDREAEEARLAARIRAAGKAIRLGPDATDEEIFAVLELWNDAMAAGDYATAFEMILPPDGWTNGDQFRDLVASLDTGPNRPLPPHSVTAVATARVPELAPPEPWMDRARERDVYRNEYVGIQVTFTLPLDGYWSPLGANFELIGDGDGTCVLALDQDLTDWRERWERTHFATRGK